MLKDRSNDPEVKLTWSDRRYQTSRVVLKFGRLPRLMWPSTELEISLSEVETFECVMCQEVAPESHFVIAVKRVVELLV